LMTVAVIGAALIGQWPEAAVVIWLFGIAEMIEALSLDRARNAIRKLMDLATDRGMPLGYGILTVEDEAQAWVRAQVTEKNKGADVARACLRMMALHERFLGGLPE